jgi:hypothetical protein
MANKKFLNPINLVNLASDPSTASEGDIYYNTTDDAVKVYASGAWLAIGSGGGIEVSTTAPSSPTIGDAWYKNDTGEFYVYDGSFWVEVNGVVASNTFSTISVSGQSDVVADSVTDTLTLIAGTNVSITTDVTSDSITINSTGAYTSVDSITYPDYITFDTSPETEPTEAGSLWWNPDFETLNVQLDSAVTLQVGQEHVVRVKNDSGSVAIPEMRVVMFAGATGDTVEVTPALSTASYEPELLLGITTEQIPADGFGFVTQFGFINKVDTSTPGWSLGDLLYVDPANAGLLTNVKPSAPNWNFPVAAVTRVHASTGRILVRAIPGKHLHDLVDVAIDSPEDNEVLAYDSTSGTWKNQTPAEAGLSASDHNHTVESLSNVVITGTPADGQALVWDTTTSKWVNETVTQDLSGYATETYVGTAISNLVDTAPTTLDTLNELAAALGDDPNFATTISTALGEKAPLASPTFTGTVTMTYPSILSDTNNNSRFGSSALASNTTGIRNIAIGSNALSANTVGLNNTAVGYNSLASNTTGENNTAIGSSALDSNTIGINNIAIGANSLSASTTASYNIAIGTNTLSSNTIGYNGIAIGFNALASNTTGWANVAIGHSALGANITGIENTAVGTYALNINRVNYNTAIGTSAMSSNQYGFYNTAIGRQSLASNTSGGYNTSVGAGSMLQNTTGVNNVAIGYNALYNNTTGQNNTVIGYSAGSSITTGGKNVIIGANTGSTIATLSNNILISDGDGNIRAQYLFLDAGWTIDGAVTLSGDLAINGGDITSSASTVNLFNGLQTINIGNLSDVVPGQQAINIASNRSAPIVNIGNSSTATAGQINIGGGYITSPVDVVISGDVYFPRGFTVTGLASIDDLSLTNPLSYEYGGTGLTTLGTAGQVLKVNSGETGLEWGTVDLSLYAPIASPTFTGTVTLSGDLAVNGGDLTSSASTVNLFTDGIDKNINIGVSPTPYTNTTGLFEGYLSNINGDLASAGMATFNQDVKVSGPMGNLIAKFGFFDKITVKNALPYSIGGTGLTTLGTAGQSLVVNTTEDGLEWSDTVGGGSVEVSETPPASPSEGDLWYNSLTGQMLVYYDNFWIESSSAVMGPEGPQGPEGPEGPQGPEGPDGGISIPQNQQVSAYTLALSDRGKHIRITTGGVTVPSGVFSVGDNFAIFNDSTSSQTITQGGGVTLRLAASTSTGNRTLAGYGLCTIMCVSNNVFVIVGAGVS